MKILGINASPKGPKSQTLKLVRAALDGAKSKGCSVELVDICKLNIDFCNACGVCYKRGKCLKKDDFQTLYSKILVADGLVMGSPNYFRSVTAQMKTMIDRMADAIHCQLLAGKYSVNVATSGGIGQYKQVTDYLDEIMLNFGSFVTGSTGVSLRSGPRALEKAEEKAYRLGELLAVDIRTGKIYRKQKRRHEENRKYFQNLVKMYKDEWVHEYKYWDKKCWQ
ncbi:MAG TPA: flavodoxin family protein [Syntrophales bacterium]|nr:flavodoxin family protein [Syntrophales bacterium]